MLFSVRMKRPVRIGDRRAGHEHVDALGRAQRVVRPPGRELEHAVGADADGDHGVAGAHGRTSPPATPSRTSRPDDPAALVTHERR